MGTEFYVFQNTKITRENEINTGSITDTHTWKSIETISVPLNSTLGFFVFDFFI